MRRESGAETMGGFTFTKNLVAMPIHESRRSVIPKDCSRDNSVNFEENIARSREKFTVPESVPLLFAVFPQSYPKNALRPLKDDACAGEKKSLT